MTDTAEAVQAEPTFQEQLLAYAATVKNPEMEGAAAHHAITGIQKLLLDDGMMLTSDSGYRMAGFKGWSEIRTLLNRHAMIEARRNYDLFREKENKKFGIDDIDRHPVEDIEAALTWLKKTDYQLFADRTYEALGSTRADFITDMRWAHMDAIAQKMAIAVEIAITDKTSSDGYNVMEAVIDRHLPALGVYGIDAKVEKHIGYSADEVSSLHRHFCARRFHDLLLEAAKLRINTEAVVKDAGKNGPVALNVAAALRFTKIDRSKDTKEYQDIIFNAAEALLKTSAVDRDESVYEGTGFTQDVFTREMNDAVDARVMSYMDALTKGDATGKLVADAQETLLRLRDLYGDLDAPDDAPPEHANEDYWLYKIFREYGYRSYSHFSEQLKIIGASSIVDNTINQEVTDPVEAHTDLLEARALLADANFPFQSARAMGSINIDLPRMQEAVLYTTPDAVQVDWNMLYHGASDTPMKVSAIDRLLEAEQRMYDAGRQGEIICNKKAIKKEQKRVFLRRAEELLFDYCICMFSQGAHKTLIDFYDYTDELEVDFLNPRIHGAMGLPTGTAHYIDDEYGKMELAAEWRFAANEENSLAERFAKLQDFRKSYNDLDEGQIRALSQFLDIEGPPRIGVLLKDIAGALFAESMAMLEDYAEDPVRAYELMRTAADCIEAQNKMALQNNSMFKALTGGMSRAKFVEDLERYKTQSEAVTKPLCTAFALATGAAAELREAMKPEHKGEAAFVKVETLARRLRDEGRSITDMDVLGPLGLNPAGLRTFMDKQAMAVASQYADRARTNKNHPVTFDSIDEHPYNLFRQCLNWVARLQEKTVLSDKHWQAMGFADRKDFIGQMQDSIIELQSELERLVVSGASMKKGPFGKLNALREIRVVNRTLGLESDRDIPEASEQTMLSTAGDAIDTAQRSILQLGYAASKQVMDEPTPMGVKYKKLRHLLGFATEMKALKWGSEAKIKEVNENFQKVVRTRIEILMAKYNARPGTPARGVNVALAVKMMADRHGLHKKEWFQSIFQDMKYLNFTGFCDYMAVQRVRQIVRRTKNANEQRTPGKQAADAAFHLSVIHDMDRIDGLMAPDGLVDERRMADIMYNLGIDADWHIQMRNLSSYVALPLMTRMTSDPTLGDTDRWNLLCDCVKIRNELNREALKGVAVDWNRLEAQMERTARRMAAIHIVVDLPRENMTVMSDNILNAARTLNMVGKDLSNTRTLELMGLTRKEAETLSDMNGLLPVFGLMNSLENAGARGQILEQYGLIMQLCETAAYANVPFTNPESLKRLGVTNPDAYLAAFDRQVMMVMTGVCGGLKNIDGNFEAMESQYDAILRMHIMTEIDKRVDAATLKEKHILTREDVAAGVMALEERKKTKAPAKLRALSPV